MTGNDRYQLGLIFPAYALRDQFEVAFTNTLSRLLERERDKYIDSNNVERYYHGHSWKTLHSSEPDNESRMVEHSHELEIPFSAIATHDLSILRAHVDGIVENMSRQFSQHLFSTIGEVTERTGNVVDAKSFADPTDAFIAMLQKVEFGVDRKGDVSRPTIYHGNKNWMQQLIASTEAKGQQFKSQIEEIIKNKEEQALEREAARLRKYAHE